MKNTYLKLGALAVALFLVLVFAGRMVLQSTGVEKAKAKTTPTAQTGGYAVANVAGAAMAYFYNISGSGYTLTLVSCAGSGPDYSCIVIAQDSQQQKACGKIPFKLTRDGRVALGQPVQEPTSKCGA